MSDNLKALSVIDAAIAETEQALAQQEILAQAVRDTDATIARLTADIRQIRDNLDAPEPPKARAAKLSSTTWLLEVAQSDLATLERRVDAQTRTVVKIGNTALTLFMQAWGELFALRKANAERQVRESFDINRLPCTASTLALCHRGVIAAKENQDLFWRVRSEPAARMIELRRLRERFAVLRPIVESEPGLSLNFSPEPELAAVEPAIETENLVGV